MIQEIEAAFDTIQQDASLDVEANFPQRVDALELLEDDMLDRIEGLLSAHNGHEALLDLQQRAESLKNTLEAVNEGFFTRLREEIISGRYNRAELKGQLGAYATVNNSAYLSYDALDRLVCGLLQIDGLPEETREREPEMVPYQPTPARIILELAEHGAINEHDVLYDLGSGLGRVPILVNLLAGIRTRGIEYEPAYCQYARQRAKCLHLPNVKFSNVDARLADYGDGTLFYLYTPFMGYILQDVLAKLAREARKRTIRLFTYGPCTPQVAQQRWLSPTRHSGAEYELAMFTSRSTSVKGI